MHRFPVLIGSKEPTPVEPIGTETGTNQNRLEPKLEPIRTDQTDGTETGTDQNRLEPKPKPIGTEIETD